MTPIFIAAQLPPSGSCCFFGSIISIRGPKVNVNFPAVLNKLLAVDGQLEPEPQALRCPAAEEHPLEKDLEKIHH